MNSFTMKSLSRRSRYRVAKLCFVVLVTTIVSTIAQAKDYLQHQYKDDRLNVKTSEGTLVFRPLSQSAVEVLYVIGDATVAPSFAVQPSLYTPAFEVLETDERLLFKGQDIEVRITKSPFSVAYYSQNKELLRHESGFYQHTGLRGVRLKLNEQEVLLGGGQRVLGMDRRGHRLPLYNKTHWGYTTESNQMYFGLPALMSTQGYGLIFDNAAKGTMDLGASESDVLQFEAVSGRNAYIVVAGVTDAQIDYAKLIKNFTAVSGRQPLPPAWAFGNFASRFGYRSEQQVKEVVGKYQESDIPLDSIVLDLYWFGPEMQGHMGNLDWDRENWPTAEKMVADFKQQGIQTIVITEPFILKTSNNWQSALNSNALAKDMSGTQPRVFDMFFGTAGLVDVFSEQGQQWFWNKYQGIFDDGIAGIWGDLGEPEVHPENTLHAIGTANEVHNAYGHQWAQLIYENHLKAFPDERLFLLMRSGFVGSQRFGMIPWTGDVSRSWGGLKPQIELSLQMGLLGLAYTHSDLGGFGGGDDVFDKEMYIRWLQYGVFQPVYRPHAFDSIPSEPVFHDQQTQSILRDWIKLRYRLFPYNYSLAWENSTTGMPLMRPVLFAENDNLELISEKQSYLWGDAFFIHPVTEPGVEQLTTRLPKGIWFNYWNNRVLSGAQQVTVPVSLDTLPIFVKAGSFVPYTEQIAPLSQHRGDALNIHYYHHSSISSAQGQLFEDDGKSRHSLNEQQYLLTTLSAELDSGSLVLNLDPTGNGFEGLPATRDIKFTIQNLPLENVQSIDVLQGNKRLSHVIQDTSDGTFVFSFAWNNQSTQINITSTNDFKKVQTQ